MVANDICVCSTHGVHHQDGTPMLASSQAWVMLPCPQRLGTLVSGVLHGGTWRHSRKEDPGYVRTLCVSHYLRFHIKFIFKFLKEEKWQNIAQASGVPPIPQIPSLCLLALISTVKVAGPRTGSSSGREEAAGWAGAAPSPADVFTVRSGLGKKWLEALGGGSSRCLWAPGRHLVWDPIS